MVTRWPRCCCNSLSGALVKSIGDRAGCTARGTEARCAHPAVAKSIANEIARRVFMQPKCVLDPWRGISTLIQRIIPCKLCCDRALTLPNNMVEVELPAE